MDDDDECMARLARGEQAAFGELLRRHQELAWRIAHQYLGDPDEARDLVQAAFLKVLEAAPTYRPQGRFRGFLRTVVSRLCLDARARPKPELLPTPPTSATRPEQGPQALAETAERARAVRAAVLALPERRRLAIVLRYWGECGHAELAEALEVSPRAAEGLLRRARQELAAALAEAAA